MSLEGKFLHIVTTAVPKDACLSKCVQVGNELEFRLKRNRHPSVFTFTISPAVCSIGSIIREIRPVSRKLELRRCSPGKNCEGKTCVFLCEAETF